MARHFSGSRSAPRGHAVDARKLVHTDPAWGSIATHIDRLPALVAIAVGVILYILLPDRLSYGPKWLLPVVESAIALPIVVNWRRETAGEMRWKRYAAVTLIAVMSLANIVSLVLLVHALLGSNVLANHQIKARDLIFWSLQIWATNVLVFALWYWELDRGGPLERCDPHHREPDFLFPQMITPGASGSVWTPKFIDYLYVAFTNAAAFSPTDTMPLTATAKVLMLVQSAASLLTVALVASRAVNILGT